MKVITENALISIQRKAKTIMERTVLNIAIANCQELDTLTISKLRPITEAPIIPEGELQVFVLVYLDHTEVPVIVSFDITGKWPHSAYHGTGWIPIPVYKPEQD